MAVHKNINPFMNFFVTTIFIFSTMYGLYYYYSIGAAEATTINGLDKSADPQTVGFFGMIPGILNFLSLINPFGLIILFLKAEIPADLFQFLDLFILLPVGWIGTFFEVNWIISKIPTVSVE